jgi:hypothetical protein
MRVERVPLERALNLSSDPPSVVLPWLRYYRLIIDPATVHAPRVNGIPAGKGLVGGGRFQIRPHCCISAVFSPSLEPNHQVEPVGHALPLAEAAIGTMLQQAGIHGVRRQVEGWGVISLQNPQAQAGVAQHPAKHLNTQMSRARHECWRPWIQSGNFSAVGSLPSLAGGIFQGISPG